jgi:hypothetical protein
MTTVEKIKMFEGKKAFVDLVGKAFEANTAKTGVEAVDYEVYKREVDGNTYFTEFLVVTFVGGGKAARVATGNSHLANYQEIGRLLNGYYEDLPFYNNVKKDLEKVM